ncbi:MAG: hypothetical protein AB8G16_08495 [Gammaproteobacteria bacterium]
MLSNHFGHQSRGFFAAVILVFAAFGAGCVSVPVASNDPAQVFAALRDDPVRVAAFMRAMPKGGDIHHHLVGAPTPEQFLALAVEQGYCLNPETLDAAAGPCRAPQIPFAQAARQPALVDALRDLWSMRRFDAGDDDAPAHFFGVFPKIWPLVADRGAVLAALKTQAVSENLLYLETQLQAPPPTDTLRAAAMEIGATDGVIPMRNALMESGALERSVLEATELLREYDRTAARRLGCDGRSERSAACDVAHRYQVYALRILPNPMVFADMVLAFELAQRMPEVVGVNVVGFEGDANSLANYSSHMQALGELKRIYPGVQLALHAGEITAREANQDALQTHVPEAVYVAGAARLGHGNAIATSAARTTLLEDLAFTGTAVEISLTSNALLLGLTDDRHHLKLLMDAGVPVTLNTDDAGIFGTNLSREYALAARRYPWLSYADFKTLSRRSLEVSFLDGPSLWLDGQVGVPVAVCADTASDGCAAYASASAKARLQVELEARFATFETAVVRGEF